MQFLTDIQATAQRLVANNSAGILTGVGVVGVVATAYLTHRAAMQANDIIREEEMRMHEEEIPDAIEKTEKVRMVWKVYVPPVAVGAATIAAVVMANRMSAKRAATMAAGYALAEQRLSEYKGKVLEKVGVKSETEIRDSIAEDRINADPPNKEVLILADGDVLCYDMLTGRYFRSTVEKIRRAENKINQELVYHQYASLTQFYDEIGLPPTQFTDEVGWNQATDGVLEVRFSSVRSNDNQPAIAIDFATSPHADYHQLY